MKKRFWAALFCAAALTASAPARAEIIERILAVVNDEIVTEQDLQYVMAPVIAQYRTVYTGQEFDEKVNKARQEFLNKVIEDKLILSEAKRLQVIVKDSEVDEMMTEVRNKFPTRDLFLGAIEEQGLTEKKLWNRFRDQLMTQKLVNYEVKSKVAVSPGEVSQYYKDHPEEFEQGDRVRLLQILIRIASRTDEDAKAAADEIYAQLQKGASFEELAKTRSEGAEAKEGGEMGWMERGHFVGEIDEKVFALDEGGVTAPIKSSLGYHLFKVVEKQKSSVRPLAEVRDKIQDKIFRDKLGKRLEEWIQTLKKNAYISIR
ncbi:MAG TPA: peptidylprolyl isomerase [Candidatus Eisenbacteria bacterium]|jgi:parvulin-like peptidyl-prolyl isomerase|nr:peptidylprolyl isomerase [Candidatus Eisenbacteria bacterium]